MKWGRILAGLFSVSLFFTIGFIFPNKAFSEEPIELKVSHFGPATWSQQTEVLEPWAKKIEKLTNGRVKFTFFPREALGKANEQYDLVVKGTADISLSLPGYTPERFPLTSVMSLPFMGESGEKASLVLWSLYKKYLQDEYKDVKVLALFCHGPGQLHTTKKQVKRLEDLKGLRIRMANPFLGKVIEKLGATPVVCPVLEAQEMLKKGELDGAGLPWEGYYSFKFFDCEYHTVINMYTLSFFVVMNKQKYESLPHDIQEIIDKNSGKEMSLMGGRAMDKEDIKGRKLAEDRGDFIYSLPKQELARWKKIAMPFGDSWVEEMKAKGLPGQEVLVYVVDLYSQVEESFPR